MIPITLLKASSKTWSLLTISLFQKCKVSVKLLSNVAIFNCLQVHVDGERTISQEVRKLLAVLLSLFLSVHLHVMLYLYVYVQ